MWALTQFDVPITFLVADIDRIIESLADKCLLVGQGQGPSTVHDALHPSSWGRLLKQLQGTIQPIFLFYRLGSLLETVRGANLPLILHCIMEFSKAEFAPEPKREPDPPWVRHTAAFKIQCRFRLRKRMQRMGVYIDGVFYTHKEVYRMRQEEQRHRHLQVLARKRANACCLIQRAWRGYATRTWFATNKKALQKRAATYRRQAQAKQSTASSLRHPSAPASPRGGLARPRSARIRRRSVSRPAPSLEKQQAQKEEAPKGAAAKGKGAKEGKRAAGQDADEGAHTGGQGSTTEAQNPQDGGQGTATQAPHSEAKDPLVTAQVPDSGAAIPDSAGSKPEIGVQSSDSADLGPESAPQALDSACVKGDDEFLADADAPQSQSAPQEDGAPPRGAAEGDAETPHMDTPHMDKIRFEFVAIAKGLEHNKRTSARLTILPPSTHLSSMED